MSNLDRLFQYMDRLRKHGFYWRAAGIAVFIAEQLHREVEDEHLQERPISGPS